MKGDFERIVLREALAREAVTNPTILRKRGYISVEEIKKKLEKLPETNPEFFKLYNIKDPQKFINHFIKIFLESLSSC